MSVETRHVLDERSFDRSVIRWIMKSVGNPRISVRLWNGDEFTVTDARPVACMEFRSRRAVFELLRSPSVGFGECYSRGLIDVHGDFLAFANEITAAITRHRGNSYYVSKLRSLLHAARRNSLSRSRHNVHHHYDLGNDFYRLWLDERMVYTCAYYDTPAATLDEAQIAKLEQLRAERDADAEREAVGDGYFWRWLYAGGFRWEDWRQWRQRDRRQRQDDLARYAGLRDGWDGLDEACVQVIAEDENRDAIGTGRLHPSGKLGRMAVMPPWRGRGVGAEIMRCLIDAARPQSSGREGGRFAGRPPASGGRRAYSDVARRATLRTVDRVCAVVGHALAA